MITDADRISGEPRISTMTMVTKTLKPRPMSFGSPLYLVLVDLKERTAYLMLTKQVASEPRC